MLKKRGSVGSRTACWVIPHVRTVERCDVAREDASHLLVGGECGILTVTVSTHQETFSLCIN
jgi:hypothetical protein